MDQSKKTMRHFYCRDVLWETFEQMANDFDCSIDYLINEAMRYYARSKNYQAAAGAPGASTGPESVPGRPPSLPESRPQMGVGPGARRTNPPPPPSLAGGDGAIPAAPRRPASAPPPSAPAMVRRTAAPPMARPEPSGALGPMLYLIFNNQRISIDKDQFIIGRGSKTSDLAIKDGNISRKHAAIIRRNGTYYIKDLGSTNGIDYKGMRIDNKRIDEGDVFHLCDYELRFTYRG
ncbi:MAG TPA: FHA domain-containing protein [Polyangia bacterium]|nr:FHA domain-containing protein [Polyangia bacterium]